MMKYVIILTIFIIVLTPSAYADITINGTQFIYGNTNITQHDPIIVKNIILDRNGLQLQKDTEEIRNYNFSRTSGLLLNLNLASFTPTQINFERQGVVIDLAGNVSGTKPADIKFDNISQVIIFENLFSTFLAGATTIVEIIFPFVVTGDGGSGTNSGGIPSLQRLVGLSITSETFIVETSDIIESEFVIQVFGDDDTTVRIIDIDTEQQFETWFDFSSFPDTIEFETELDNSRLFTDPARFTNTGFNDFVLFIPTVSCSELDPFVTPIPCLDPIVYNVPLTFTFTKGGVEFVEKHTVRIDATSPIIICDIICQTVNFLNNNYWWLGGIIIIIMILYFGAGTVRRKGVRTVRRIDNKQFTSFSANKPTIKFKRGKR